MAARLTDKQRKKIIADYVEIGSYNAVAKKNGTSNHTVKRIVLAVPELSAIVQQKKNENTTDILEYMESKRGIICEIIGLGLDALRSPDKLADAAPSQITTALGTLIDKFTAPGVSRNEAEQAENTLALADVIRSPALNRNIEDFEE